MSIIAAVGAATAGAVAALAAAVAPVAETAGGSTAASYVQGGGSAAAVAGLIYVARLIAKGELVPRPVKDTENELTAGILAAAQRESRVLQIAEEAAENLREERRRHDDSLLLLADVRRSLAETSAEMAYWREMRERGTRREDRRS